ncbi:cytochrome P450 704C1-like [Camellia sinensis]|uniref:cytochrome P450 704C1-like n=1 Tax=Camellia sinensis TaxID=4442 RepID=UPI001036BABC|nr:cytochrome P450 704C1-like [Camellia sinensis]
MTKFPTFHMMEILPKTFYMMGILFFPCTGFFLLTGFFVGLSFILVVVGVLTFFVIGLAAVFLVIYIRELISNDNRHPVAGPIFNLLIHFNRLFNYQTSLARKYSTYRLITPFKSDVYTADPVNIGYILKTKFSNYGKGKFNSNLMRDLSGDGIFAVDGEKWRHQRKLASYEFSTKVLRDFSATVFRTNAAKLASDVSIAATTKQMIDLQRGKEDILSRFLMESAKDPEKMTDKYLRDISLNFIIAGKDTSANTLTWFFYMLCRHPFVQEKIAQEVREATEAEDNISTDEFANKLTEADLEKMWYLHAALTETLRLYPAVPVDRKNSEEDDILPDGFKVKKGDGVNYMAYAMGRMTYIWGEDAADFRPERWLDNGIFRVESSFKFTAFQAGPRICLGKEFAYGQMKLLASSLLFFFKFKLVDESKEATYRTMFTLRMVKGLHLYAFSCL